MLQARFNLVTADPLRLADSVKFMETEVRPRIENVSGSLGLSLFANPELGVAVLESFWASREALVLSETTASPKRREAVRLGKGTVTVERYRVPVFEREAPLVTGAGVRLTRMDVEPSRVEDTVEVYGETTVPWLADTEGFCSALLLVNRGSGHSICETIWQDSQALAASRSAAAAIRVQLVEETSALIRAVEEYGLVFSSARKG